MSANFTKAGGTTYITGPETIWGYEDDSLNWYTDTYNCFGTMVERFEPPWGVGYYPDNDHINVVLDERITEIGRFAFADCESLRRVTIPNPRCTIARNAFQGCRDVTIVAPVGSEAERFARQKQFPFEPLH